MLNIVHEEFVRKYPRICMDCVSNSINMDGRILNTKKETQKKENNKRRSVSFRWYMVGL